MMTQLDPIAVLYSVCVAPWLLAGWLRVPYYVKQLQTHGYNFEQYGAWLNKAEDSYFLKFILVLTMLLFFPVPCVLVIVGAFIAFDHPIVAAVIYVILWGLAMYFAPHSSFSGQKLRSTGRTARLTITAFFLEPVLPFLAAWLTGSAITSLSNPPSSPEAMGIFGPIIAGLIIGVCLLMGPITYILTRYIVAGAEALNWPFDGVLSRA